MISLLLAAWIAGASPAMNAGGWVAVKIVKTNDIVVFSCDKGIGTASTIIHNSRNKLIVNYSMCYSI